MSIWVAIQKCRDQWLIEALSEPGSGYGLRSRPGSDSELSSSARGFTIDTGIQVYLRGPRSPWQRDSNENTNGLLRQYCPTGKALAPYSQADLDKAAAPLNGRPRQTLGWKTPSPTLEQALD